MKFQYNQSDRSFNMFTKFDQNPTHSKRDITRKSVTDSNIDSETDRETHTHTHTQTHTQIKFLGATDCDDKSNIISPLR